MNRRQLALEILSLYAFAAVSCASPDTQPEKDGKPGEPDAGTKGGVDAGPADAGTKPVPSAKPFCTPPDPAKPACSGGRMDFLNQFRPCHEGTQCYVKKPGVACLAADDSKTVGSLADYISSIGFVAEFVLEDVPGVDVPASCAPVLACCPQLTDYKVTECYDALDEPKRHQYCAATTPEMLKQRYGCEVSVAASDADAGASQSTEEKTSLCCYRTCGYDHAT